MDSFANTSREYSDGQKNIEPIPDEIQAYGFKPPVKLPDGNIEEGDYLAANHLNFLLNDLYKKLSSALVVIESGGTPQNGYRRFSNGDIEAWGRGTPNANGDATVTYPIALPEATGDVQVNSMNNSQTGTNDFNIHATMVIDTTYTRTGFRTKSAYIPNGGGAPIASPNGFLWRAYYHAGLK